MKGDPKVIEFLNKALTNELTAINQYWLHYRVLEDWGVSRLAEYERLESIDEMKHADILAERILTSGQIFEDILASEEEHVDFLETQFDMIERMGLQNYVQLNSKPAGEGEQG